MNGKQLEPHSLSTYETLFLSISDIHLVNSAKESTRHLRFNMYIKTRIDMRRSSFLSNECSSLFLSSASRWVSKKSVRSGGNPWLWRRKLPPSDESKGWCSVLVDFNAPVMILRWGYAWWALWSPLPLGKGIILVVLILLNPEKFGGRIDCGYTAAQRAIPIPGG